MIKAVDIRIRGIVQGVGFRPFLCRLASLCRIRGGVYNDTEGVVVRAEGEGVDVDLFIRDLSDTAPPLAMILSVDVSGTTPSGKSGFGILPSRVEEGGRLAFYSPDVAMCD
ncbi:MAG: carbamoyltransferase HypF, partial [Chrysiogenales bacterium]